MNFLYCNPTDEPVLSFDASGEIISKNRFFREADKYICADNETLIYRRELFHDIVKVEGLSVFLATLFEKLRSYEPLMRGQNPDLNRENSIKSLLYPTAYTEIVDFIHGNLSSFESKLTARSLLELLRSVRLETETDEYQKISKYYDKNAEKLKNIHSITVGVNLSATLEPTEAGILSLNSKEFSSGDIFDRILRLDFQKDDFHCIAPLTSIDKKLGYTESQQINYAVLKALGRVLDDGMKHCSKKMLAYVSRKLRELYEMYDSLAFVVVAAKRIRVLLEKKIPLCFPEISEDGGISVTDLYDDALCDSKEKKDIIPNTVELAPAVPCHILTGPNSGGKSVFLSSVAFAQYYFQLGMPIPARAAKLPIYDRIFKISADEAAATDLVGRFEKECLAISSVLKSFTKNSLALIDEAFTSTSAEEALPIAENFITELSKIGGKCIFATHFHTLGNSLEERGDKIGYLHTESEAGKRMYRVKSGKSDNSSFAADIAKKYGLC